MELVDKYRETMLKLEVSVRNAKEVLKEYKELNKEGLDCDKVLLQKIKEILSAS